MQQSVLRTPIVSILGHVDHGKTTLLDKIRKTRVTAKEAGGITQHIGATEIPVDLIRDICKDVWGVKVDVPGLLFIDTPGHRAFTNLRKRGGALADLAVLIIDINEGIKPQTEEAISILKTFKTPFVVAANKIDRISGWQASEFSSFMKAYSQQDDFTRERLDNKIYELIGELYKHGFSADRFDRIADFTKTVAIIPISALTGAGIPELLMILLGLAQRFMEERLRLHVEGKARGTILEVKEEKGIGMTCDIILYDGKLQVGDRIVIAGIDDVVVTHIKGILKPRPAREMRVESKFKSVKSISAAAGVKVTAPNLENVLAGSEFEEIESDEDIVQFKARIRKEYEDIAISTEEEGIVLKTDTVGSLEALINELRTSDISIKKAEVGYVDKKDVIAASANKDELNRVILAFNVKILPGIVEEAKRYGVRIFEGRIIYSIIDEYLEWRHEEERLRERQKIEALIKPAKIKLLKDFIFRRSKPAVVGVKVLAGELRKDVKLIKTDGMNAGIVKSIQKGGENINIAVENDEIAVAIEGATIGRTLQGDEELLVEIPEKHAKVIERDLFETLNENMKKAFKEFIELKRKENPFWGK
jgi:translation initiation factor 5B